MASTIPPDVVKLAAPGPAGSLVFGLSQTQALVILFVVLPLVLAAVVVPLVSWRSSAGPPPVLTRDILATGRPATAEIISVRTLGSILDVRPMVRFQLQVAASGSAEPFELEVVQSIPRAVLRDFRPGQTVDVRLTDDLTRGAVVWDRAP